MANHNEKVVSIPTPPNRGAGVTGAGIHRYPLSKSHWDWKFEIVILKNCDVGNPVRLQHTSFKVPHAGVYINNFLLGTSGGRRQPATSSRRCCKTYVTYSICSHNNGNIKSACCSCLSVPH